MSTPGFLVEVQSQVGTWEPRYATTSRERLAAFLERAVPYDDEKPTVMRISRITVDDEAVQ